MALLLGCSLADNGGRVKTDSLAAIRAVSGSSVRVTHARIIDAIRRQVEGKRLLITHVRGHSGVTGNEVVDRLAKEA